METTLSQVRDKLIEIREILRIDDQANETIINLGIFTMSLDDAIADIRQAEGYSKEYKTEDELIYYFNYQQNKVFIIQHNKEIITSITTFYELSKIIDSLYDVQTLDINGAILRKDHVKHIINHLFDKNNNKTTLRMMFD